MKRMVLGLSLALAVLGFLAAPAMAAVGPHQGTPSLNAFLTSLGAPVAPVAAAKRPALPVKALCSASANCWDGSTVSCQGNNSTTSCTGTDSNCSAGQQGGVTCDGVTTSCPPCQTSGCGTDFCTHDWDCAMSCYPCDYTYTCNETYCTDICRCNFRTCPQ